MSETPSAAEQSYPDFTLTRIFDAPRAVLWRAWTDPQEFATWWGSAGMVVPVETTRIDLQVGGQWYARMESPAFGAHPFCGVYEQIEEPSTLVFAMTDAEVPDPDRSATVTVTFIEVDGQTEMTLRQAGDFGEEPEVMRAQLTVGYGQFFDRLAATATRLSS